MLGLLAAALLAPTPPSTPAPVAPETAAPKSAAPETQSGIQRAVVGEDHRHGRRQGQAAGLPLSNQPFRQGRGDLRQGNGGQHRGGHRGETGTFSKVTFERRFSPGGRLDSGKLHPGDTLLGRQVMFLTFDASGSIASCKVVATTGDAPPAYDCDEARKEQFRSQVSEDSSARQAFMTVLAYGHSEQIA